MSVHSLRISPDPQPLKRRTVTRSLRPELAIPGHDATNFEAETLDALESFLLSPGDVRFLHACMIRATKPDSSAPDGRVVMLRDDQWTRWRDLMRYCGVLQRHRPNLTIPASADTPAASLSR